MTMISKVVKSLSEEGITGCAVRTKNFVKKKVKAHSSGTLTYKDILFISGCREDLPHPWRYRVSHQREQLEACNISTDEVYFQELTMNHLRYYRVFVFFRCPCTELIGKFVAVAKKMDKKVIYDVDDLVIDTVYTDQITYVQKMSSEDKAAYDANVRNMGHLLKMCDLAITTTNCLADELKKYVPKVIINRNAASEMMVDLSRQARERTDSPSAKIRMGYFSGSITHNSDFQMILPVIADIMKCNKQVELCVVGELDIPDELKKYEDRIVKLPFSDWQKLPEMIAGVDINLAPLEDTIFNRAKSENKWVEAALVKVPTVASDIGAFHDSIENGVDGVLCSDKEEWKNALEKLILDPEYRRRLGNTAYDNCVMYHTTVKRAMGFVHTLLREMPKNYVFVLPGLEISGGMKVALKHAVMLRKAGKDVILFTLDNQERWLDFEGMKFPVLSIKHTEMEGNIGCAVATMWTTLSFVEQYANIDRRCYLVQNYEADFYAEGDPLRIMANRTYMPHNHVEFLTISKWCQNWLDEWYGQKALYAPNGLEIDKFTVGNRTFEGKIKILIEGDCSAEHKNVDEAFRVVNELSSDKYEIWYMSYNAEPKEWYRVDRFLHRVPYDKVPEIYEACDILLKTSLLESFSYPPIEMMAAGGCVVVVPNGGNSEYLQDEVNCLLYPAGDIKKAVQQIERICSDKALQVKLGENGRKTAEEHDWKVIQNKILEMYI